MGLDRSPTNQHKIFLVSDIHFDQNFMDNRLLYVGNLAPEVDLSVLTNSMTHFFLVLLLICFFSTIVAFGAFGIVVDINIPKEKDGIFFFSIFVISLSIGTPRGFAFVEFENAEDAKEAAFNMNLSELFGRTIHVTITRYSAGIVTDPDSKRPGLNCLELLLLSVFFSI